MSREESDREDLLREATTLVERIELVSRSTDDRAVVAGFRRDGALSIFFGEDAVYQFNAAGELRRAYCDGTLIKAVRGHLVSLQRVRTETETQLVSREISQTQEAEFLGRMTDNIQKFASLINANAFEVAGQVPEDSDVIGRLQKWLATHTRWQIAARPNA